MRYLSKYSPWQIFFNTFETIKDHFTTILCFYQSLCECLVISCGCIPCRCLTSLSEQWETRGAEPGGCLPEPSLSQDWVGQHKLHASCPGPWGQIRGPAEPTQWPQAPTPGVKTHTTLHPSCERKIVQTKVSSLVELNVKNDLEENLEERSRVLFCSKERAANTWSPRLSA